MHTASNRLSSCYNRVAFSSPAKSFSRSGQGASQFQVHAACGDEHQANLATQRLDKSSTRVLQLQMSPSCRSRAAGRLRALYPTRRKWLPAKHGSLTPLTQAAAAKHVRRHHMSTWLNTKKSISHCCENKSCVSIIFIPCVQYVSSCHSIVAATSEWAECAKAQPQSATNARKYHTMAAGWMQPVPRARCTADGENLRCETWRWWGPTWERQGLRTPARHCTAAETPLPPNAYPSRDLPDTQAGDPALSHSLSPPPNPQAWVTGRQRSPHYAVATVPLYARPARPHCRCLTTSTCLP